MKPDVEMTFGEHLEELRRRVVWALAGVLVAAAACGFFYKDLFRAFLRPYEEAIERTAADLAAKRGTGGMVAPGPDETPTEARLRKLELELAKVRKGRIIPGNPVSVYLTIVIMCVLVGTMIASPWVIYQIWAFVAVGLYPHERKVIYIYGPASFVLFISGAALFYFLLLPLGLRALMAPAADIDILDASYVLGDYAKFFAWLTIVFGLVFQTPLVVLFLARTRIIPLRTLARQQKYVILVMTVAAAVLTPTQDPISMALMAVPLVLLYEAGLLVAWLSERRSRAAATLEEDA
jgi:Tat protein translocase TatC